MRKLLALMIVLASISAQAAIHYISKSAGADSNNGTAKATPWAHVPGMIGATGNAGSYTPVPGDQFILKGGDTWVAADLGINTCPAGCWNGTQANPIQITVDKTWFSGASWVRPRFDCQNTSCTLTGGAIMWMYSDWWVLDNIEFTGYQQSGTGTIITIVGAGVEVKNNYIHNFSRTAGSSGSNSFCFSTNFAAGGLGLNSSIHDNVCDGQDSPNKDFMGGILHGFHVYNNVIRYVYNGMNGVFADIHGNLVENNYISTSGDHCNMIFPQDLYPGAGNTVYIYNNVVRNKTCGTTIFTLANSSNTSAIAYQFNNVLYDNASGNDGIGSGGHTATGVYYDFNNTVQSADNCFGNGEAPATKSVTHYGNNHCIAPTVCVSTGTTCTNEGGNLQQTLAQANAAGYTDLQAYAFSPTTVSSPTVNTGINQSSLCTGPVAALCSDTSYATYDTVNHAVVMRTVVPRPASGAWNIGAYQFAAAAPSTPFTQTNNCPATLTATTSCTITVFFAPTTAGVQNANLRVASNASTSPNLAALTGTGATPATLTLTPGVVNFGRVVTGTTSDIAPVTLANAGGAAATITSITTSAGFSQTNNCPGSLGSNLSCTINVTASPVALGILNGTLTVVASAAGSPFTAELSVLGVAPAVTLNTPSVAFGNQVAGTASAVQNWSFTNSGSSPLNFTINKTGTNPGDFTVTFGSGGGCVSPLAQGSTCTGTVFFQPTTTGARSATIQIVDDAAGSPHTISLTGTGISPAPAVCLSTPSLTFGNQTVGTTSVAQTETVTNCGTANLVITSVSVTVVGDFNPSSTCGTVIPQGTCAINVTFSPTGTGLRTSTLTILSNSASSPDTVPLSGTGVTTGATVLPASINFGNQIVSVPSTAQTITVTNTGSLSLVVNTPTITGTNAADYSFSGFCGTVAPNSNCIYSVVLTPSNTGARSATFNQTFGGGVSTQTVSLTGTGIAAVPVVTLAPTSINFGNVQQHTASSTQTIQLTNTGNANLNITSILATGANAADMTVTSNCTSPLAAGTPCTVDVFCTPSTTAAESASVTFTTDAASSPDNVTLSCTGTAAPAPHIKTPLPTLTFTSTQVGSISGAQVATIINDGNANLVISSVSLAGTNPGDFLQVNNCATVVPAASCAITVNFRPTAAGSRSATVSIVSNAGSSPDSVSLSGTAVAGTPNLVLAISSINFGNQTVGVPSSPVVFTLSNTGTASVTSLVVAVTAGGQDFTVSDNCGGSIGAGGSCSAQVRFNPQQLCGQFSQSNPSQCISNVHLGIIRVTSNTPQSPQTISLQGTATQIPPAGPVKVTMSGHLAVGGNIRVNR